MFLSTLRSTTVVTIGHNSLASLSRSSRIQSRSWNVTRQSFRHHTKNIRMKTTTSVQAYQNEPSLVSSQWLKDRLQDVKVLDATWYLPHLQKDPIDEFIRLGRIPGAQFFDLDGICQPDTDLPHMLPTETAFAAAADALGISPTDTVVLYDRQGIFSAPRAWWTWKVLGHQGQVAVLDGGFDDWVAHCGDDMVEVTDVDRADIDQARQACREAYNAPGEDTSKPLYTAFLRKDLVRSLDEVVQNEHEIIIDARPAARFAGEAEEPRKGLAKGHIPGSKNIPWNAVLTEGAKAFKSKEDICTVFKGVGLDPAEADFTRVVASCGSGTTACILVLASEQIHGKKGTMSVYDGSWSQYGGASGVQVDVGLE